jgi:hypothetical protein
MAKPVVAGIMMIAAALLSAALKVFEVAPTIPIALAGILGLAAIHLFIGKPSSWLISLTATGIGIAGNIYLLVQTFQLMRMGAVAALVGLIPLAAIALLVVALVLILMWRPAGA